MYNNINCFNKDFFLCLQKTLLSTEVDYCIIGDYINLPNNVNHDIDIWTNDPFLFWNCIDTVINRLAYKILIKNTTANGFNVVVYKSRTDSIDIIKIDVLSDCSYKSFLTLVSSKSISENIMNYKGFRVANEKIEAIMHFLYPFFEWGKIKENYKIDILRYIEEDEFYSVFKKLFGRNRSNRIINLIKLEKWDDVFKLRKSYRRIAFIKFILSKDLKQFKNILLMLKTNFKRYIKPSGFYIVLTGLDGAGKTTIIDNLNIIFCGVLKNKKVYKSYWRPYLLPEIKTLLTNPFKKVVLNNSKENINREELYGILISSFKFIYYLIDYIFGFFCFVSIRAKGGIVLFDRHYLDMLIHPNRFGFKLPKSIMLFFYRFIPKPDITFFLWTNPIEIHKRKKEFTELEISNQINLYNKFGNRLNNYIPIETNKTVLEEISEILDYMSLKNR